MKNQKGLALLVIVLIIAAIGFFVPMPYYEKEDRWCESDPPRLCSPKGWHLGPSLWQRFSGQLEKPVSSTTKPTPAYRRPPDAPTMSKPDKNVQQLTGKHTVMQQKVIR